MKKVQGAKILAEYDESIVKLAAPEIYVTVEGVGDDAFRNMHDTKEDAVSSGDTAGELVLTYRLVKIEELALKRTVVVVKAK